MVVKKCRIINYISRFGEKMSILKNVDLKKILSVLSPFLLLLMLEISYDGGVLPLIINVVDLPLERSIPSWYSIYSLPYSVYSLMKYSVSVVVEDGFSGSLKCEGIILFQNY
jgi:hypothetical protein